MTLAGRRRTFASRLFRICGLLCVCTNIALAAQVPFWQTEEAHELSRHKRDELPSEDQKKMIVDCHNDMRATVGDEGEEPIPADMRYMSWDDGLAYTSLLYAYQCAWEHSPKSERRTPVLKFDNGENLWSGSGQLAMEFDPVYAIGKWYEEFQWYEFYNQTCEPNQLCGHYTQVVWATTYKIGCAWTICPTMKNLPGRQELMYFVCQYAPGGNVEGVPAYKVGPRCSECRSSDTCYEGALCKNPSRDKLIEFTPPSGGAAAAVVMLLLLLGGGGGAYYFLIVKGKYQEILAWRKKRRISSTADSNGDPKEGDGGGDKKIEVEDINGNDSAEPPAATIATTAIPD